MKVSAQKRFETLKKRYSRKRNNVKKASASVVGTSDVSASERELQEYAFLHWLKPFIQHRRTKTNLSIDNEKSNPTASTSTTIAYSDISNSDNTEDYEMENESKTKEN